MSFREYEAMLLDTDHSFCWWCGRQPEDIPDGWCGPWLIERAHICASPRKLDRRAVILLDSKCHKIQHGERFSSNDARITLANMIWLKQKMDPKYFDIEFLQMHHVGRLPDAKKPFGWSVL